MTNENTNNLEVGSSLNHYRILKQIGAGGMGEVYLAEDEKLERRVALKILPVDLAKDTERMRRFVLEAKSASALNQPNIITIYEIGESDGINYIATEFIEGETLSGKIKSDSLKLSDALKIAVQIASALDAAHSAGIVHRDIKPDNVMIRPDGLVKILDFGVAKLTEKKSEAFDAEAATAINAGTISGMIIGTASYMSPEQAAGKVVDARSDVFSFGIVLYEMIAGRQPFAGETLMEIIGSILHQEPAPVSQFLAAEVPREIERIVGKTLRKDRDQRYQTARDLLIDLQDARQELEFQNKLERTASPNREQAETQIINAATRETPPTASSAEYIAAEIKNHKPGFIVLSVLLLAAIGFGYWFYSNSSAVATQIESIAVMPFVNESGNADTEYLSDGMTETMISSLSQLPKLNVKARSSVFRYKGKDTNAQTVGKELNVQAILNGTIVQRGQDLALHIELVDAQTETVLWSADYKQPMANLVSLQSDITRDVSGKLKIKLSGADEQKLAKTYTDNAEAYQFYLKGRYYWLKFPANEFEKSRDYYQQAVDVDPTYALAYAGLAEYYGFGAAVGVLPPDENWSKSEAATNKALALDDTLPDAHNALAGVKQFNNDRAGAEQELRRAIELNPNYAEGRDHYAHYLSEAGRVEESLAQIKKVLELEPLSVRYNRGLAVFFYRTREYDRAIEQFQKTLELDSNDAYTHELLGKTYEQKRMQKEAVAEWSKALTLTGDSESARILERNFSESGFNAAVRTLWQKKLEQLDEKTRRGEYVPAMNYALAYTRLADKEQAFAWLAKAAEERNRLIFDIKLDPIYNSLRDDPRFQDLLRRVNLP